MVTWSLAKIGFGIVFLSLVGRLVLVHGQMEVGSGLGHDARCTRPADVLVPNWVLGKPAAFDITVTSPLTPITLHEASVTSGSTAQVAENRKHASNDTKCSELGWVGVPLAVEVYGCWGPEAQTFLNLQCAWQLDQIVASPRPLRLSMAG